MPKRGMGGATGEALGGSAHFGGREEFCGDCSPEPLNLLTATPMKVRACGIVMQCGAQVVHVDVIECPGCGKQVLR